MPRESQAEKLARIEAENAALRDELAAAQRELDAVEEAAPVPPRRSRGRSIGAVALITVGAILAPFALAANWAQAELTDTDRFVASVAPILKSPEVQDFVVDKVVEIVNQNVDVDSLTSQVFDGLQSVVGPRAAAALGLLEGPATAGLHTLIETTVRKVVTSSQFSDLAEQGLRVTHAQLVKALSGDDSGAITIDANGTVSLQLAPVLDQVRTTLVDAGFSFASAIPTTDASIALVQSDKLAQLVTAYRVAVVVGVWLPWIVLLILAAGVLLAHRRSKALLAAGLALAGSTAILGVGIIFGRFAVAAALSPLVPIGVSQEIYNDMLTYLRALITVVIVLGLAVALVGYLAAPYRSSRALRGLVDSGADSLRESSERHGFTTGSFGVALGRYRIPIRVAIGVGAFLVLLFSRPLTPAVVIWTLVIALLLVVIARLLERPQPAPVVVVEEVVVEEDLVSVEDSTGN